MGAVQEPFSNADDEVFSLMQNPQALQVMAESPMWRNMLRGLEHVGPGDWKALRRMCKVLICQCVRQQIITRSTILGTGGTSSAATLQPAPVANAECPPYDDPLY